MSINKTIDGLSPLKECLGIKEGNVSYTCAGCFIRYENVPKHHNCKCPYSRELKGK
jgi:hypothetical protein